jgi:hypothetical protein
MRKARAVQGTRQAGGRGYHCFRGSSSSELERHIGESAARELRSEVEVVETVYPVFESKTTSMVPFVRYFLAPP